MQIKTVLTALVGAAMIADAAEVRRSPFHRALERRQRNGNNNGNNRGGNNNNNGNNRNGNNGNNGNNNGGNNNNGGGRQLSANAVQRGSAQDGNNPGSDQQAASATFVAHPDWTWTQANTGQ